MSKNELKVLLIICAVYVIIQGWALYAIIQGWNVNH